MLWTLIVAKKKRKTLIKKGTVFRLFIVHSKNTNGREKKMNRHRPVLQRTESLGQVIEARSEPLSPKATIYKPSGAWHYFRYAYKNGYVVLDTPDTIKRIPPSFMFKAEVEPSRIEDLIELLHRFGFTRERLIQCADEKWRIMGYKGKLDSARYVIIESNWNTHEITMFPKSSNTLPSLLCRVCKDHVRYGARCKRCQVAYCHECCPGLYEPDDKQPDSEFCIRIFSRVWCDACCPVYQLKNG